MNPLTQIKNQLKATKREIELGLSESASWHAEFKHSAYVFVGGLDFGLTEGDVLAVFSQYGEVVDVHLVRDGETGKSRGFCFLAYEDQRSTNLAVDNLSGSKVAERIIRVEHVKDFKKQKAEMDGGVISRDDEVGGREEGRRREGPFEGDERAAAAGGRDEKPERPSKGSEPWQQGGSYADLLREADEIQKQKKQKIAEDDRRGRSDRDRDRKKEKKQKKDKKEKKDKRHRSRSRERERSRSR